MNVLIVGLGSIAKKHISALRTLPESFTIYALRSSKLAEKYEDVINIFDLESENYDFAIISNPTHLHSKYIKLLAKKAIPLFIEKPAVHNLDNVDQVIATVEKKKIKTYIACNLRFHPCIIFLKDIIGSESLEINEINVYCGSYLPDWRPGRNYKEIYSANPELGGGVHLDVYHELDYVTWLFGFPKSYKSVKRSVSSLKIKSIDYANYILNYDNFTASIILNYYRKKTKREIEINFKDTTWNINLINGKIITDDNFILFEAKDFNILDTYKLQLDYFINCIKNDILPMNSLNNSIQTLQICLNNEK
jgi:predicted dehydrogenase